MATLHKLTAEMEILLTAISDFDGEVTETDVEARFDALFAKMEDVREELGDKCDAYVHLIDELSHLAAGQKAEADRLAKLAKRNAGNAENLHDRLKMFLGRILPADKEGKQVMRTRLHEFRIGNVGGLRAMTISDDLNIQLLPEDLVILVPEQVIPAHKVVNKDALRAKLEETEGHCTVCGIAKTAHDLEDAPIGEPHAYEPFFYGVAKLLPRGRKLSIK